MALANPFPVGSRGWGILVHQNHAPGEENGSIMVGMFVPLCLDSNKSSDREFFVPTGMHLGVKLLSDKHTEDVTYRRTKPRCPQNHLNLTMVIILPPPAPSLCPLSLSSSINTQ